MGTTSDLRSLLRVAPGTSPGLDAIDPRSTPGLSGRSRAVGKRRGKKRVARDDFGAELAELQARLYAEAEGGDSPRRLLVVLQGMDTSGKDGTCKHVVGLLNPSGVSITAFKAPTAAEKRHDFLWRIRRALPSAGQVGIFNRSHYEDVLIARVHDLVPRQEWEQRYALIDAFESEIAAQGVTLLKIMLHISYEGQRARLLARLADPTKRWKFHESDIDERAYWPAYQEAYDVALTRCSTDVAPWYVVPADRKWYRNWAVGRLMLEMLREMDPHYPQPDLDLKRLRKRLPSTPAPTLLSEPPPAVQAGDPPAAG